MVSWSQSSRIKAFRTSLTEMNVAWHGDDIQLYEYLVRAIDSIPDEKIKDAMHRHYVQNEGPAKDETTRRIVKVDSRYYQFLERGRVAVATLIQSGVKL